MEPAIDQINCPFCHPQEKILLENSLAYVLLSDPRKTAGHLLIIPKRHIEKPWELSEVELQAVFELIFKVQKKIIGELGEGCDIRQNYRPFIKQNKLKIDHLLFHVIPRSLNDYIYSVSERYETDLFAELDDVERQAVSKLIA